MMVPVTNTKVPMLLVIAMLLVFTACLFAEPQMQISYVNGFIFTMGDFDTVYAMEGDTLVLYDYNIQNRTINFNRATIAPDCIISPMQTVFSYEVPLAWGDIWDYPLFFEFKNGKLYTAFDTDAMFLVFFTNAHDTQVHAFDRSDMQFIIATHIIDENSGYISAFQYPNYRGWICSLDFNTHEMPLFYQPPISDSPDRYEFLSFGDEYLLAWQLGEEGDNLLIHNSAIVQTLSEGWGYQTSGYRNTQILCGNHYYTFESGILEKDTRDDSRSIMAWVENNQLDRLVLDSGFDWQGPDQIINAIPQSDSTFTCIFTGDLPVISEFRNYRISNHNLIPDDFFPNLSGFPNSMGQFRMDDDYTIAIAGITAPVWRFILVDYPEQSIRSYDITLSCPMDYSYTYYHSNRYLYWLSWHNNSRVVQIFHLELGSSAPEESLPQPQAKLDIYPNPFSSLCTIQVESKSQSSAKLGVYNLKGQLVKSLHQGSLISGLNSYNWDGKDSHNQAVSSGIYLLKLESAKGTITKRLSLIH